MTSHGDPQALRSAERSGGRFFSRRTLARMPAPVSLRAAAVFGIIGVLALKLALGSGGKAASQQGALETVVHEPPARGC